MSRKIQNLKQITSIAFYVLATLLVFASCEMENSWENTQPVTKSVVVDAILIDQNIRQTIQLHRAISILNETPEPISQAQVQVSSDEKVYNFTETPIGSGVYISDSAFQCTTQFEYSLIATVDEIVYTAKARMKPVQDFEKATVKFNTSKNLYYLSWIASTFSEINPAMYEISLDWSGVSGYENLPFLETHAKVYGYTLQTIDVSQVLPPAIESVQFPAGTLITERKYSLTNEHSAFLRGMLLETSWQGGLFNTSSAKVPTNISNGGLGFFAVCSVLEKKWKIE